MIEIRNINEHTKIGLLDLKVFSQLNTITQKRDIEKTGAQFLLQHLLNTTDFELTYTDTKKPLLKGKNDHISISHSHDKLAIIINKNENTGIDVELIRDKVLAIKHKFLNENEAHFAKEGVEILTYIWAAKETLYKIYGLKGLDFKLHLSVEINNEDDTFLGTIITNDLKKTYLLKKEKIQNHCLVYALNEI